MCRNNSFKLTNHINTVSDLKKSCMISLSFVCYIGVCCAEKAENQPIIFPDKTAVTFYHNPICRILQPVFMELQQKQLTPQITVTSSGSSSVFSSFHNGGRSRDKYNETAGCLQE